MALFNEILVGRFNRGIQKLFGIKGGPPAAQLSSEIAVNHQLQSGAENRYLEGWNLLSGVYQTAVSGAAQNAALRFRNPAGSNTIAVFFAISTVDLVSSTANNYAGIALGATAANLTTVVSAPSSIDPRFGVGSSLIVSQQVAAAGLGTVLRFFPYTVNVLQELLQWGVEIPLLPGQALQLTTASITGSSPMVNALWRERFLEDSERF